MDNNNFLISVGLARKLSLDDQASWYVEFYEEIDQFPIKECTELFKQTNASTASVCILDLDVRCHALIDLLDNSKGNSRYQIELANKLKEKCASKDRQDLSDLLDSAVARRILRDAQIQRELNEVKNKYVNNK